RNAAAGRGAQDDDAKHDPSPGDSGLKTQTELQAPYTRLNYKRRKVDTGLGHSSTMGTCQTRKSTCVRYEMRYRLLAGGAHIHVDFHADRNFDDFWCFPSH